jgi:hypothetical protein
MKEAAKKAGFVPAGAGENPLNGLFQSGRFRHVRDEYTAVLVYQNGKLYRAHKAGSNQYLHPVYDKGNLRWEEEREATRHIDPPNYFIAETMTREKVIEWMDFCDKYKAAAEAAAAEKQATFETGKRIHEEQIARLTAKGATIGHQTNTYCFVRYKIYEVHFYLHENGLTRTDIRVTTSNIEDIL